MSITVYKQTKAFVFLSRYNLFRFSFSSAGCIGSYIIGRKLCKNSESPRTRAYGEICRHYGKMCGVILWGHVLVTCSGAMIYARAKNLPRAVYLQRGFTYGEKLGFGTMCVYAVTRELSSREWLAQVAAGGYSGMKYSLLQGQRGWTAYHSTRIGVYGGITLFVIYSLAQCVCELWNILKDPELTYSQWHNFDIEEYFFHRLKHFFNVKKWVAYFQHHDVEDAIIVARKEMDELELLMDQAGLDGKDLEHVNVEKVSEVIFGVLDQIRTGRPEFDDVSRTTSTVLETRLRQFDPHYESGTGQSGGRLVSNTGTVAI